LDQPAPRERRAKRVKRGYPGRKVRREPAAKQDCVDPQDLKGQSAKKVRPDHRGHRALAARRDHRVLLDRQASRACAPST
jgi:hypothetical protein